MRWVIPVSLVLATLIVSPASALWSDTNQSRISQAGQRESDAPISVAQVEKVFRHRAGLEGPLRDLSLPRRRWVRMDWGFNKNGFPVAGLTAYVNALHARRASIIERSGRLYEYRWCRGCKPQQIACSGCVTFRVRNVLLVLLKADVPRSNAPGLTALQERDLRSDLAKLGTPVVP